VVDCRWLNRLTPVSKHAWRLLPGCALLLEWFVARRTLLGFWVHTPAKGGRQTKHVQPISSPDHGGQEGTRQARICRQSVPATPI